MLKDNAKRKKITKKAEKKTKGEFTLRLPYFNSFKIIKAPFKFAFTSHSSPFN